MVAIFTVFWFLYKQAKQLSTEAEEAIGARYWSSYPLEKLNLRGREQEYR